MNENTTKITTANVRIMLSFNYSNFEVACQLENANGIEIADIDKARAQCQQLANDAVNEYKTKLPTDPKKELERIDTKLNEIRASIPDKSKELKDNVTAAEAEKIATLPTFEEAKKAKGGKK